MPQPLRFDASQAADGRRWMVGVALASRCERIAAALLSVRGKGLAAVADVVGARTIGVPLATSALFDALSNGQGRAVASLAALRRQLAELEAPLVIELLDALGVAPGRVLGVGIDDPGIWEYDRGEPTGYLGLCDPARVAEATGLNVIDAFPARDLAVGGQGGPLTGLPNWILLRDPLRSRVLLDLGRTIRFSYLPASNTPRAETRVASFDAGPGLSLLDSLTERLTGGQHHFDPGGRLAVQGKRLPELVQHWLSNPYFDGPPPRWHARGVRPDRFLADAVRMAVASGWSVRDLLCTATRFIAEMIARALHRRLPNGAAIDEIVIVGGGQHNGMLLREIGCLTTLPLTRLGDLGLPAESLDPAAVGLLAMLHIDQVPANSTSLTGATTPRLLGRLTGGAPQNWQLLLETCAGSNSALRPLRAAV